MIISFREGCCGRWLGALLANDSQASAKFRQDSDPADIKKINMLLIDGQSDDDLITYNQIDKKIISCHSTNYNLLRQMWPNKAIYRIKPKTKVFKAIAMCYLKKQEVQSDNIDDVLRVIKRYYNFHTSGDPEPTLPNTYTIDFGQLENPHYIEQIFNLKLSEVQLKFLKEYWELQQNVEPVNEYDLKKFITKQELYRIFSKETTEYNIAFFIFIYELLNNLTEDKRKWSIDNTYKSMPWEDLIKLMEYR